MLKYTGSAHYRHRINAATLSSKKLRIDNIRASNDDPNGFGLVSHEANYLKLIDVLSDGTVIEINETGTTLKYIPGIIVNGSNITFDCGTDDNARSIGWYIEGIIPLAIFGKQSLSITFHGITNDAKDLSIDTLMSVTIPILRNFGIEGASIKIKRRGAAPNGGGIVELYLPIVRELRPIDITDTGLICRVRGLAFCARISPTILSRVVDATREVLNNLLPDVHIHTDHFKGADGGNSAGYSLSLVAESTTGALISIDRTAVTNKNGMGELPEDVGREGSLLLLEEINRGGVVDSSHQCLMIQLMVMTPEDVSKIRLGPLTTNAIKLLRIIRDAFGITFKVREDKSNGTVLLSCLGSGSRNTSRKVT